MSAPAVISSQSSRDLASQVSIVSRIAQSIELRYRPNSYFRLGRVNVFPGFSYEKRDTRPSRKYELGRYLSSIDWAILETVDTCEAKSQLLTELITTITI